MGTRMRAALIAGATLLVACAAGAAPAQAVTTPPGREQLARAMLTLDQMTTLGLAPLAGAGAVVTGDPNPANSYVRFRHYVDSYAFADATSPGKRDERSVMMTVTIGRANTGRRDCEVDDGLDVRRVGRHDCMAVRDIDHSGHPQDVVYGIRVSPTVLVTATVSAPMVSEHPTWSPPTTAQMKAAAHALATAQVARLKEQGLTR